MNGVIHYLNTDLDLKSIEDLTEFASALEASGVFPLHVERGDDRLWYASFETEEQHTEPESNIAEMLAVIESLNPLLQLVWSGCSLREFNVGYDCGAEPWAFNQGLSAGLLAQMGAVGASLRLTLYPDRDDASPTANEDQKQC